MDELACERVLVITEDYEGDEVFNGRKIPFFPLWKWLLELPGANG